MATTEPPRGEPRHLPALDGLRAVALLMVMLHHWSQLNATARWSDHSPLGKLVFFIGNGTWCGVDLFFVLSGFLITGILLDTRTQPSYFSNFYLRRTLRIFPPYYLFLFAVFVLARPLAASHPALRDLSHQQLWYWLYIENWHTAFYSWAPYPVLHLWSLAVEEQFYLVWPLLVFFSGPRRMIVISIILMAASPIARVLILHDPGFAHAEAFIYVATITRLGPLVLGALLAALLRLPGGRAKVRKLAPFLALPGWLCLLAIVGLTRQMAKTDPLMQIYGYSALALLFAGVLAYVVTHNIESGFVRLLQLRWLRWIGKVSYVTYIVHLPIFVLAARLMHGTPALELALAAALSFALAALSWRFFEKPLLALKNRLAPSLSNPAAPVQAAPPALESAG